ncbi:MAG TPA: amidase family protein, partial [Thermomicrobiales bacterium]|nr:amidase family protein [Thermomicrobiales bacterium]
MQQSQPPWRNSRQKALSRRAALGAGVALVAGLGGVAWALDSNDKLPGTSPTPTPAPTSTPPPPTATTIPTPTPTATRAPASPVSSPAASPAAIAAADLLVEAKLSDLRAAIDNGSVTIVELVQATLDRVTAMDGNDTDTVLHAVIETNPDALAIAKTLDEELQAGESRGPLHGIPVMVKDVFASGDQMKTTAGALALAENTVVEDSFLVARLRDAGMVLMGKANMSEWSAFRSSGLGSGWSGRGGQASNPYVLDRSPWGSSAGSAIAVASSYVPFALGAETDGSILCPSSACAVVGLKPTVGLTSRVGVIPISSSQDSPGAIARNVYDLAVFFSAIAGYDAEDSAYNEFSGSAPASEFSTWPVPDVGSVD